MGQYAPHVLSEAVADRLAILESIVGRRLIRVDLRAGLGVLKHEPL